MAIKTGPLYSLHEYQTSNYIIIESNSGGKAEIEYDHTNKRFNVFEINFNKIEIEDLSSFICFLKKIEEKFNPKPKTKKKSWWKFY